MSSNNAYTDAGSTSDKAARPPGRPRDPAKATAVLDAAWALFLDRGVEPVPIEAIAARAGVSKGTLYALFADKAALFEAAVRREMDRIETTQSIGPGEPLCDGPLADTLRVFGRGILTFLASPPAIGFYNALAAELRRHPTMAHAFWTLGPGRTRANLARILVAANERGEINAADPEAAAEMLFGSWQGFGNLRVALGVDQPDTIETRVERGIQMFMRAFPPVATIGVPTAC